MSLNPLVSILIPAYNSEKWIKQTIKSAVSQTWNNIELIIVDDGSSDNTFEIAKSFESKSVKVVSQPNSGASAARNKALSLAQGDFIQWLDSDDLIAPDKIEIQLKSSNFDPHTLELHSSSWGFFFFNIQRANFSSNPLWQDLTPVEWLKYHIGEGYFMFPAVWLVSRELTDLAGLWDERLSLNDDGEYFARLVSVSKKVCFDSEAKSYHRVGNLSSLSSGQSSLKAIKSLSLSINLCVDYLLSLENNKDTKQASIKCLSGVIDAINEKDKSIIDLNRKRIAELGGSIPPSNKSLKFKAAQQLLGIQQAFKLKSILWNIEILTRKYWDKFLSIFYKNVL